MGVMERRKRRAFTKEFKAETVRLGIEGGRSVPEVSRDLDLTNRRFACGCTTQRSIPGEGSRAS